MDSFTQAFQSSHRRWNPLKKEWILVSPHRLKRPWQGAVEPSQESSLPSYVADCYLCPGNQRAEGVSNPKYDATFAFDNDFAAVVPFAEDSDAEKLSKSALNGIIHAENVFGRCRVLCFSPRHDLTLPDMDVASIVKVIELWQSEYKILSADERIQHIMIFENKGQVMGCSNPHPHCQIWATSSIPHLPSVISNSQVQYKKENGRTVLHDYLAWELEQKSRIVSENATWVALVPFWAQWPYEVMIVPRRSIQNVLALTEEERLNWAEILKDVTQRYDKLFQTSFPYSMGIYQAPNTAENWDGVVLHQVFLPPLLRSATVKKFMVGYELSAEPQRDITAEMAAERLRLL